MSDSGSYQSSHSSVNRDSGSHQPRRASGDRRLMSSECNGAGDVDDGEAAEADDMLGHVQDADAATDDAVSTEYETLRLLLDILFTVTGYW